jgi:tricorn protease-like protein
MKKYSNDEIIKFFEDAGYSNVEIVGDRLLFTSGEDVHNWSLNEAIKFIEA